MNTDRRRIPTLTSAVLTVAIGVAIWALTAPSGRALNDGWQLLSGGNSMGENTTIYTSPGMSNQYQIDFPGTGLGEQAAEIRMPGATLRSLKVNITTKTAPSAGAATVMVRLDGANTQLTCQVAGTGECTSGKIVTIPNGARLAVRVSNNFTDADTITYTYVLIMD